MLVEAMIRYENLVLSNHKTKEELKRLKEAGGVPDGTKVGEYEKLIREEQRAREILSARIVELQSVLENSCESLREIVKAESIHMHPVMKLKLVQVVEEIGEVLN